VDSSSNDALQGVLEASDHFDSNAQQEVFAALDAKGVTGLCPACGNQGYYFAGYGSQRFFKDRRATRVIYAAPTVLVECDTCGFLSEFDLSSLGLPAEH